VAGAALDAAADIVGSRQALGVAAYLYSAGIPVVCPIPAVFLDRQEHLENEY
jgi:hypothetical protein